MTQDIFIKIKGIDGESQDESHPKEIDVIGWRWQISQQSDMHSGSGGGDDCHEQVRLSFARMKQEYILQNRQGGSSGTITGLIDVKANQFA